MQMKYDSTVTLGNIIQIISLLVVVMGGFIYLEKRLGLMESRILLNEYRLMTAENIQKDLATSQQNITQILMENNNIRRQSNERIN